MAQADQLRRLRPMTGLEAEGTKRLGMQPPETANTHTTQGCGN